MKNNTILWSMRAVQAQHVFEMQSVLTVEHALEYCAMNSKGVPVDGDDITVGRSRT